MIRQWLLISAMVLFFIPAAAVAQEPAPERKIVDLGFSPTELIKQRSLTKAGSLERQRAKEKLLTPEVRSDIDKYDVTYYDIYWRPDFSDSSIYGEVTIHGISLDPALTMVLVFLHENMEVDSIYNDVGVLTDLPQAGLLFVYLDRTYSLGEEFNFTVVYEGRPPPLELFYEGLMFSKHEGVPIVENLSEPYSARYWWPCKDVPWDKADSSDVRVMVDTGMVATSNGLLISDIDHEDGTHTMHWQSRYPITTYNICLAVTNYVYTTDYYVYSPTDSMPIVNYVFPEFYESESLAFDVTATAIAVFADLFCEYPFINEKYGHSMCNMHGMEHQTNTFLNPFFCTHEPTVVHELAHHWWGNLVTCQDWPHIWLNEGFATYCEALFYEYINGPEYFHTYMSEIEYWDGGTVYVYEVSDPLAIFDIRSYWKGAWVVHMLRGAVGDEAFFDGLSQYAATFAYGTATSDDLKEVMEDVSGQELDPFFDQWLLGTHYPSYRFGYFIEDNNSGGSNVYLHVRQRQDTDPEVFIMPIRIHLITDTGEVITRVFNDRREQDFVINSDEKVNALTFDPDHWILCHAVWEEYGFHIVNNELFPPCQAEFYCDSIKARGGAGEYTCQLTAGALPDGWILDESSCIISGMSVEDGTFAFTIKAADAYYPQYYSDSITYTVTMGIPSPRPGDANADGEDNVGDAVHIINFVFNGGPAPPIPNWADVNSDCQVNVGDAVYLINFIFRSGPDPLMGCVD